MDLNSSAIKLLPWTNCYQRALENNNTAIFLTARLPQREQLFKWAGPIISGKYVLFARKDKNISITATEDLRKYKIGTIKDDVAVQLLLDKGLKKEDLMLETASAPIIEMLDNGSIDAWAYNDITGIWQIQESGRNANDYRAAYTLGNFEAYLAFNNKTPDSLVNSFQQAIDYIKTHKDSSGVSDYDKILSRYIPASYIASTTKQDEAKAFLDEAVAYLKENGKENAIREFNNRSGPFVRGDLYLFGYDLNGTCIVHPINSSLIGKKGLSDANGVDIVGRELALAGRGGGTLYIVFPNPSHGGKKELKQLYIETVNNSMFLGTGVYLSNISASFNQTEKDKLVAYVNDALQFAKKNGRQKALAAFNDKNGNFTKDGRYIFAYDYEGRNLALPFQPELIGTNRIDVRDPNGVDFVRQAIDIAKMGSGFHYYVYPDPARNMTPALKLGYVADVDGTWFLGSGIYAGGD